MSLPTHSCAGLRDRNPRSHIRDRSCTYLQVNSIYSAILYARMRCRSGAVVWSADLPQGEFCRTLL